MRFEINEDENTAFNLRITVPNGNKTVMNVTINNTRVTENLRLRENISTHNR